MPKVLVTPSTLRSADATYLRVLRDAGLDVVFPEKQGLLTEEELDRELQGIEAVIASSEPYTRRIIENHPQLRVIARSGVGYDAVDVNAATERGVAVCITPGTNHDAVAEHTFALMLACAKNVVQQDQGTRKGLWPRSVTLPLRGKTLGIAGLGRIGKAVAIRGACFKMRLLAYEPYPDHEFARQWNVAFVDWATLLAEADYLSLHIPLTAESRHMINREALARMKPTAFLINTARGGLVCERDLLEALTTGKLAGAGLDVFEEEPARDNPLFALDNVVVTPHAAGVDAQSRDDMAVAAAQAIAALYRGDWPEPQIVNPGIRERFRWEQ